MAKRAFGLIAARRAPLDFGALYPAVGEDATVSGLGSAALATGGVAPVTIGIFVNE